MPGDVAELRAAVSTAVDALDGWTLSRWAPALFGRDTDHVLHHAFAVDIPETVVDGFERQRPGIDLAAWATSTVDLLWAHRLRGDAQVIDTDGATDAEQAVVKAVVAISSTNILVERMARRAGPEGWILGTIRFRVTHRYALTT